MPRSGLGKVREFGQAATLVRRHGLWLRALRRECAWPQPEVTGEHVTILAVGKCVAACRSAVLQWGAPRGKICPLYQEGGARDAR